MDAIRWEERPKLRRPVLVAAFEGWNDAGEAATQAARYLSITWHGRRIGDIDPEEFFDFTANRPEVRLVDGETREITWPPNEIWAARVPSSAHDVLFLHGTEPGLRWRTFCEQVLAVVERFDVELVVTLGALLTEVPHSRPVHVIGTASDPDLIDRFGLARSRYEGPTGIVGVLHTALHDAGTPSLSLWASVPHYLGHNPSPKATLALVQRASDLLGAPLRATDLEIAAAAYDRQVAELVAANDELAEYVAGLEQEAALEEIEEEAGDDVEGSARDLASRPLPGGDELAAEVERYLREQGG